MINVYFHSKNVACNALFIRAGQDRVIRRSYNSKERYLHFTYFVKTVFGTRITNNCNILKFYSVIGIKVIVIF